MLSVSSVYLSQVCGLDTHSTSEIFPDINHHRSHSSLKNFSLQTDGCWGSDPRLADSAAATLTFLSSTIPLDLLHISLETVNILFTSMFAVSLHFVIIIHIWFAIWFPSKRMSPASNVTASPKHQCKQHSERWCAGKPNRTELCLGPKNVHEHSKARMRKFFQVI